MSCTPTDQTEHIKGKKKKDKNEAAGFHGPSMLQSRVPFPSHTAATLIQRRRQCSCGLFPKAQGEGGGGVSGVGGGRQEKTVSSDYMTSYCTIRAQTH